MYTDNTQWSGGHEARDASLALVIEHERQAWRTLHDTELLRFLVLRAGHHFITEDFRRWFLERGNEPPHHPNVWGAMWRRCAAAGWIVKTGTTRTLIGRVSHARLTQEWRKAGEGDFLC